MDAKNKNRPEDWLHAHPGTAYELGLDENHIIVDREDREEARKNHHSKLPVVQEIEQRIAEELIGVMPIHKGPFVSNAEALRCAHFDNQKRFDVAERIATAIVKLMKGEEG